MKGLRLDGRKAGELRRIQCRLGVYGQADGSAYLEQGNSKVINVINRWFAGIFHNRKYSDLQFEVAVLILIVKGLILQYDHVCEMHQIRYRYCIIYCN
jgi:hypothetical protein